MPSDASYFSDRESGPLSRVSEKIGRPAWGGIASLIQSRASDGSLGASFPEPCPDGRGTIGTNYEAFALSLNAEIPDLTWPFETAHAPPTLAILDLVEFVFRSLGKPLVRDHHDFFGHDHLLYNRAEGQAEFHRDINRILARNGLAFELGMDGNVVRLAGPVVRESLAAGGFFTGDDKLNLMLEAARAKFLDPDPIVRREALEKLWDAWERLKTILPGSDKKSGITALLNQTSSEPQFRSRLEIEAKELTTIGNSFQIRHSETTQVPLNDDSHVDYLFHRLFALIWLILRNKDRA
jgi:hypothetical protein